MTPMSRTSVSSTQNPKAQAKRKEIPDISNTADKKLGSCRTIPTPSNNEDTRPTFEKSGIPDIVDVKASSGKVEDLSGIYDNRFGKPSVRKAQHPGLPHGSPVLKDECEIVIPTRAYVSDVCRHFTRGYCSRGARCPYIHYFNKYDEVNQNILRDISKGHYPKVKPRLLVQ
ncbi:hypothetical protein J3R30DRAFT_1600539 [Lentinula aciculospora]|uniref:C3H1-type domain-containing protein n=1 Tax=Lentinula aciculospora TaxID=153920 RepID=A0A9W9DFZ2_9AGAR|nr:hypothetical protein J3R30DRAFT_1600539 [Lentinula aciculospora]